MRAQRQTRRSAPTGRLARTIRTAALVLGLPAVAIGGLSLPSPAVADESTGEPADRPSPVGTAGATGTAGVLALDRPLVSEDRDVRHGQLIPSRAQRTAAHRLAATVRWTRFATPAEITRVDGPLATGLPGGSRVEVARGFLAANRLLFRMSADRVRDLEVVQDSRLTDGLTDGTGPGASAAQDVVASAVPDEDAPAVRDAGRAGVVTFRERFGSLPAGAGGLVSVAVAGNQVVYVTSSAYGDAAPPPPARLTPVQAWLRAAADVGRVVSPGSVGLLDRPRDRRRWTTFTVVGMAQAQQARLVAVGVPGRGVRPAYEVNVVDVQGGEAYADTSFVDAVTGAVLVLHHRVDHLGTEDARPEYSPPSSADAAVNNAARTAPAWYDLLVPPAVVQRTVAGPGAGFTDSWHRSRCASATLVPGGNDVDAAVANVFSLHSRLHDWTYALGFDEGRGNLQQVNPGTPGTRAGLDGDRELGHVQTAAVSGGFPTFTGRNGAHQVTLQDGLPGIAGHYLFQPVAAQWYGPCVDGAFDAGVVAHEYAHAMASRLVGGPDAGITTVAGRAVAEGWADLVAAEFLAETGTRTSPEARSTTGPAESAAIGAYVAGSDWRGVRNYRIGTAPLNYGNVGYDPAGGLAADGEIWSAVNWDIRRALVRKYAATAPPGDRALQRSCARGALPVTRCPGNRRWIQLLVDSMSLQQSSVSMLGARNALLAANRLRFGGADLPELWEAFARRGFGARATAPGGDRRGEPDFTVPGFVRPAAAHVQLVMAAIARPYGRSVAGARIHVGRYADPSTPVADTDPATTRGMTVRLLPGRYELTWSAPGYGMGHTTVTLKAGRTRHLTLYLNPNLASAANGARVLPGGSSHGQEAAQLDALVDDRESTAWSVTGQRPDARGTTVTVDLAGSAPRWVRSVRVSAVTTDRFAALRRFAVETCAQVQGGPRCDGPHGRWTRILAPAAGPAFDTARPRPMRPDLGFRDFDVRDRRATHLRLVVLDTQCTGNPAYRGEQEADPLATSNCLASAEAGDIAVAELMVYGADRHTRHAPTRSAVWN
ncbi:M36 family metallopeptidase [Actinopolymorpha sp. NPDC004070]|uniref:M36 family metallopeptidase n=1 Tax=Actinopolymorpha sp. NPDC004070 TaxID=3154548 RepID=UPI0033AA0A78